MCGRYSIISKVKAIEKRFNVSSDKQFKFEANTNVSAGNTAPVITSDKPNELQFFKFGLTPDWAKNQYYMINARSEGDYNKENSKEYNGSMGIITKPMFRKPIRSQRCLVPADCFFEGPKKEKLSRPYVVYLNDRNRPFAFAGIWDQWLDKNSGELLNSFAIVTTAANRLMDKIGHERSPVILHPEHESLWLNKDSNLNDILGLLQPYPDELMNAYPVSADVKSPDANGIELLEPIGERLNKEYDYLVYNEIKLEGMGETTARIRRNNEGRQVRLF